MVTGTPSPVSIDQVQIFDAGEASGGSRRPDGRAGMATSPNCDIAVLQAAPRGQIQAPVERDADVIVLVLQGEATVQGPSGTHPLKPDQGVLIPAGVSCTFTSTSDEDLALLTFRSDSVESRPGYLPNTPSGVKVRVPEAEINAKGVGGNLYVFALDHQTIRVSTIIRPEPAAGRLDVPEWNQEAFLRMNCAYERSGDDILVNLPERMVRWYGVRGLTETDYRIIPEPERTSVRVDLSPLIEREAQVS